MEQAKLFGAGGIPMPGLGGALPPKLRKTRAPSAMTTGDTMTGHGDAPPVPAAVPLPFGAAAKPPATFSAAGASSGGGAPSSIDEDEAKPAEPLAHAVLEKKQPSSSSWFLVTGYLTLVK